MCPALPSAACAAVQGPSPDEVALVDSARQMGFVFKERLQSSVVLDMLGQEVTYEVLNVMEYSSDRWGGDGVRAGQGWWPGGWAGPAGEVRGAQRHGVQLRQMGGSRGRLGWLGGALTVGRMGAWVLKCNALGVWMCVARLWWGSAMRCTISWVHLRAGRCSIELAPCP